MAHIKFIDTAIRALKPPLKGRVTYWAVGIPSLGLRVSSAGRKSFISKLTFEGKDKYVTHGIYPSMTIKSAIEAHGKAGQKIEKGENPSVRSDLDVISKLGDGYFKDRLANGYLDVKNQKWMFEKDIVPILGHKSPPQVTTRHIRDCLKKTLDRIQAENPDKEGAGLSHIRHLQVLLRGFFKWLVSRGMIDKNPTLDIETVGIARARERVLTPLEIWRFWNGIEISTLEDSVINALRFMLATGQRSKEVRSLKWSDIDDDFKFWQISAKTAKNKKMHRVPLNDVAQKIIKGARPLKYKRPDQDIYVFGATKMLSESALSKALRRKRNDIQVEDVTPHDLRRTVATMITAVGLPSLYASLLLNHAQQGVTNRVYVQYTYDFEKTRAANVWEKILNLIVKAKTPDKVLTIDQIRQKIKSDGLV